MSRHVATFARESKSESAGVCVTLARSMQIDSFWDKIGIATDCFPDILATIMAFLSDVGDKIDVFFAVGRILLEF